MGLEQFDEGSEGLRCGAGLRSPMEAYSPAEMDYIREILPVNWERMSPEECREALSLLDDRLSELSPTGIRQALDADPQVREALAPVLHELPEEMLEAPQDFLQIEQVSDLLADCGELRFENWRHLSPGEMIDVLNDLETRIARVAHRLPAVVSANTLPMDEYGTVWGGYADGRIVINSACLERSTTNPELYEKIIETLIHEGRHAYQDYNIHVRSVHPRQSEVNSWIENEQQGYASGDMSEIGVRLYRFQPTEIDARQFAEDTLKRLNEKTISR